MRKASLTARSLLAAWVFLSCLSVQGIDRCEAADDLYQERLDRGLRNTDPYSYLLMERASQDKGHARELLEEAKKYSPDLPSVYFALAEESLRPSAEGIFESLEYLRQGLKAYERSFLWQFTLAGSLYISLAVSFVLSLFIVAAVRFPMEYRLLLHDIREDRRKIAFIAPPLILSFFGVFSFAVGVLFLVGFYSKRRRDRALVYSAFLFFLATPLLVGRGNVFLSPLSPELKAVVAVNEGRDNRYALTALKASVREAPLFSYALALKREGDYGRAIALYEDLKARWADHRVYTNLGNAYYAAKTPDAAIESYRKAAALRPTPAAYYNLSQVYRGKFDFAKGDEYFLAAARLDREAVSRFSSISGASPNRFVVDETLPASVLWKYAGSKAGLAGGPLSAIGVALIAAFFLLNRKIKVKANRCGRCGAVFCAKCSRILTRGEMCPKCYTFLMKAEEMDSRERIERLLSIYQSQTRKRRITRLLSYAMPGAGLIYAGRLLGGMLFMWPSLFFLFLLLVTGFAPVGPAPFTHGWVSVLSGLCMCVVYLFSIFYVRKGINRGWL